MLRRLRFYLAYRQRPIWDTGISPPELLSYIDSHAPARALDLGCGTGTNAITLAKHGWQVTGVDFAPRAIKIAREKAIHKGVKIDFLLDDVTRLKSIRGNFDLLLDIGCFPGLSPQEHIKYIANINRLLSSGGNYLLYTFFKEKANDRGPGATEDDILQLSRVLLLLHRENSTERNIRSSAWMTFKKP